MRIAIIATGMVLVIVSRNIDLSVGSLVGLIAMSYALLMTDWFPRIFGIRLTPRTSGSSRSRSAHRDRRRILGRSRGSSSLPSACRQLS